MTSLPFEPPIFTRRVELSGAVNFRDLGGYRSTDGRQVRWRQLYRSDSLADLTDADLDVLSGIGLRSVCDLRHESERVKRPDKLPSGSPASLHQIGFFPHRAESLFKRLADKDISASEVEEFLCAAYRAFPIAQRVIYKGVLDILVADGALPALIHCTSGK